MPRPPSNSKNAPPRNHQGGGFKISPRELFGLILERWWIGLLVGAIASTLFVIYQPKVEPIYRADVSVLFEQRKDRVLNIQEVVDPTVQSASELRVHIEQI